MVEKKPVVKVSKPPLYPRVNESLGKTNKKKGVCYVEPCDWLNKKKPVVKTKPTKPKSWKGTLFKCVVGCRYAWWDSEGNNYDEDGNLVLNTVPKKSSTNTKKKFRNEKGLWMCWEPEFGWLDFKTGKPLGEYRECGWRDRGSRTADAIERGIKECGGYMNWTWTDEHHTKYRCNSKPVEKTKPKKKGNWECIVPPCDFIDEDGNLIED